MADLTVIVPSRGRPEAARTLAQAFASTCTADTRLIFAVDDDDPTLPEYSDVPRSWYDVHRPSINLCIVDNPSTMVHALNAVAHYEVEVFGQPPYAVGFMGDDHCPRTVGWDARYLDALRDLGTGIVYGNDLFQQHRLPTQVAMTSDIVRAVGYMAPPALRHLFVDNTWLRWGKSLDRIRYLPDVIVEHRHPVAGKAQWDEGYLRVNSGEVARHDEAAFNTYCREQLDDDLAKIRAAAAVPA